MQALRPAFVVGSHAVGNALKPAALPCSAFLGAACYNGGSPLGTSSQCPKPISDPSLSTCAFRQPSCSGASSSRDCFYSAVDVQQNESQFSGMVPCLVPGEAASRTLPLVPIFVPMAPIFLPMSTDTVFYQSAGLVDDERNLDNVPQDVFFIHETPDADQTRPREGNDHSKRSGAMRRQQRRRRQTLGLASPQEEGVQLEPAAMQNVDTACLPDGSRMQLWPATPESTPPQSPRLPVAPCMDWGVSDVVPMHTSSKADIMMADLSDCDTSRRRNAIAAVAADLWSLANTASGSWLVQKAISVADKEEQLLLLEELKGHVRAAYASPHANHVLQKCVASLPPSRVRFLVEELEGHAVIAAKNRFGCRILERMIEYFPTEDIRGLVDEVLRETDTLCRHCFGNFVIQHILVHGTESQKHQVASVLVADVARLARHRIASHVVKAALTNCCDDDKQRLANVLSADAEEFADLVHHHCGSFVAREMKRVIGFRR